MFVRAGSAELTPLINDPMPSALIAHPHSAPIEILDDGKEDDNDHGDTAHAEFPKALEIYNTWITVLEAAGLTPDLDDMGNDMRVITLTRIFCPVTDHFNTGTRHIRDEAWAESMESGNGDISYFDFVVSTTPGVVQRESPKSKLYASGRCST
ncbi:hypothetical protein EYZ11_006810 [Aspergillus tanneri]|uniref:Uncharacterized protein n=1 Tax=Aspergillus tanneri TaxID=1220188 RepID=A0A4S3JEH9_9EURO|nr:hypothetical protein EYZ11_006810 [Aspergillus tanneri]